jgi:glycosyltransferase involved in cell wall biosynthesis
VHLQIELVMTLTAETSASASMSGSSARSDGMSRVFDGVICFGGADWWYHNRGHYDMQMMRELSRMIPVLHVNSVGIRVPRLGEGRMFFRRVGRKLRSLGRGFVKVRDGFGVLSPVALPGRTGMLISRRLLVPQVRLAAWRMGIRRPLVWVTCPPAVEVVDHLYPLAVVYQRTDRWEEFPGCDPVRMREYHRRLQRRADLTLFCSTILHEEESSGCRSAAYVDHGVDYERFAAAGTDAASEPADVRQLPRPRVGFVGGIDSHTFDPALFLTVARSMPECHFVLVGGCSLPAGWCELENVSLLGQRPYDAVASYMAACDVLIMPWNQNEWINACNPVKLKEYLAVGRPIVTTPFHELHRYEGCVSRADSAGEFIAKIREALAVPADSERLRERVRSQTWQAKADLVLQHLREGGIICTGRLSADGICCDLPGITESCH